MTRQRCAAVVIMRCDAGALTGPAQAFSQTAVVLVLSSVWNARARQTSRHCEMVRRPLAPWPARRYRGSSLVVTENSAGTSTKEVST